MHCMDAPAHLLVNLFDKRQLAEHGRLHPDDVLVVAQCRSGLRLSGRYLVYLASRLVYQGEHHIERESLALKQFCREGIAMVDEVAGEDSCQMQLLALLGCTFLYML